MAKLGLISLSLCFLLVLDSSLAFQFQWQQQSQRGRRQPQFGTCNFDRLEALEPHRLIQAEAGTIEAWNPRENPLQCAGVSFVRYTIEPQGLVLPSYSNSPQLLYIDEGKGMVGVVFPGCAETFEEEYPPRSRREEPGQTRTGRDRHQKIRHFREGDVIALPAGIAHWTYNYGESRIVAVSLYDKGNSQNQLDQIGRKFFLAGNPELPRQEEEGGRGKPGQEGNNVFSGFDTRFLADLLNVDEETVRKMQGHDDQRKNIVKVRGAGLDVVAPPRAREEREREEQRERERERQEWGRGRRDSNGLEETICSAKLRENIGDSARADIFNPEAGRISTVNSYNLPILNLLQLSAERGVLYRNAISLPHWNANAHSLVYVTRGRARVQVVDHNGNSVFRDDLRQGQLLFIPQNFAVGAESGEEGFEYISFKTNDNAVVNTLAGRVSFLAGIPEDVVANSFQVSREQARQLKFNPRQTRLIASNSKSRGY